MRHNKYKTKHCQKYWIAGYCAYGPRCNFIHQEKENQKSSGMIATAGEALRRGATMPTAFFK